MASEKKKENKSRRNNRRASKRSGGEAKFSHPLKTVFTSGSQFTAPSVKTALRWSFNGSSASSSSYVESIVAGNNLFDPGLSIASNQPVGFDQWAAFYAFYRVLASKLSMKMVMSSTSTTPTATSVGGSLVVYPSTSSSAAADLKEAFGQPHAQFKIFTSTNPVTVVMRKKLSDMFGLKAAGYDTSGSLITGGPDFQWYWHIGSAEGTYTNIVVNINLVIDYEVEFYGRKFLPLSTLEKGQKITLELLRVEAEKAKSRPVRKLVECPDLKESESFRDAISVPQATLKPENPEQKSDWDIEESDEEFLKGLRKRGPY